MKSSISEGSLWTLYSVEKNGVENWGPVWMSDSDLKKFYRWDAKLKRYSHRKYKNKYIKSGAQT